MFSHQRVAQRAQGLVREVEAGPSFEYRSLLLQKANLRGRELRRWIEKQRSLDRLPSEAHARGLARAHGRRGRAELVARGEQLVPALRHAEAEVGESSEDEDPQQQEHVIHAARLDV